MGILYSPAFLTVLGILLADVAVGLALLGLARAQLRLGHWEAADRWYRRRLAAPLPATRLLLDGLHRQRPYLQFERLREMAGFGRHEEAAAYGRELAEAPSSPDWLKTIGAAHAVGALGQVGHFEPALSRLEALLAELPPAALGLRGLLESMRLPLLVALGRWSEAERCADAAEGELGGSPSHWPLMHFVVLLMSDQERRLLRLARPLLEQDGERSEGPVSEPAWAGLVLSARAAEEIGWTDLRDQLLTRLDELPRAAAPVALLAGLAAVAAAERGDDAALDEAIAQVAEDLAAVNRASGQASEAERLLVRAEIRAGRREAALERARGLAQQAISPLGRWRSCRSLGEAAEAAGRREEALEAYSDALATGIDSALVPEIERRVAALAVA